MRRLVAVPMVVALLAGCATPPPSEAPRTADGALAFAFEDHEGRGHRLALPISAAEADAARDARGIVGRLLAFFQSIPYDALQTRYADRGGAGFASPIALFAQNRGDCDTKSVAMAGALRMLAPELGVAMVLIDGDAGRDGHALLAVALAPNADDATIMVDGRPWVLIEPTGPARLKTGEIAASTEATLRRAIILPLFDA